MRPSSLQAAAPRRRGTGDVRAGGRVDSADGPRVGQGQRRRRGRVNGARGGSWRRQQQSVVDVLGGKQQSGRVRQSLLPAATAQSSGCTRRRWVARPRSLFRGLLLTSQARWLLSSAGTISSGAKSVGAESALHAGAATSGSDWPEISSRSGPSAPRARQPSTSFLGSWSSPGLMRRRPCPARLDKGHCGAGRRAQPGPPDPSGRRRPRPH